MSRTARLLPLAILTLLLCLPIGQCCKDLVARGDATAGDYTLLLKVRDPSRPGPQVLIKVPAGYQYTYHAPWTGRPLPFTVTHRFIAVASANDTPPHIIKAGMALTDAGIAYGDADTASHWTNPTPNAWDDFDWLRYAYQTANTTTDALTLLIHATTILHATAVGENLFTIGPTDAYLTEADALHTHTTPITSLLAKSNYPTALWPTQWLNTRPLARTYNATATAWLHRGQTLRLGSLCGIRLTSIGPTSIRVKPVPAAYFRLRNHITNATTITLHDSAVIAGYHVTLENLTTDTAQIRLRYKFADWEDTLLTIMNARYGAITAEDFMNWSRLHTQDLDGLRPMCEDAYPDEGSMIFQIPTHNASFLSSGWFAANHACASIYVPIHVCDTDIDPLYTTPEAANLSYSLLTTYGHGTLSTTFHQTEHVFLQENSRLEALATTLPTANATRILTVADTGAQHQAFQTEYLWSILASYIHDPAYALLRQDIERLWNSTYLETLTRMNNTVNHIIDYYPLALQIGFLAINIVNTTLCTTSCQGITIPQYLVDLYQQGVYEIYHHEIPTGVALLLQVYTQLQELP